MTLHACNSGPGANYSLDRLNAALATLNPHFVAQTVILQGPMAKGLWPITPPRHWWMKDKPSSPTHHHIFSYTERLWSAAPLPSDFVNLLLPSAADATDDLSEYEALTLMAFMGQPNPSDVLVLEILGGRLDATNVVQVAATTDIGWITPIFWGQRFVILPPKKRALLNPTAPLSLIWITQPMCLKLLKIMPNKTKPQCIGRHQNQGSMNETKHWLQLP